MANRKGIETIQKWRTSDGKEFESVREANDHQGAINELDHYASSFLAEYTNFKELPEQSLKDILYAWELHKNQATAQSRIPDPGVESEPSSAMDVSGSDKKK